MASESDHTKLTNNTGIKETSLSDNADTTNGNANVYTTFNNPTLVYSTPTPKEQRTKQTQGITGHNTPQNQFNHAPVFMYSTHKLMQDAQQPQYHGDEHHEARYEYEESDGNVGDAYAICTGNQHDEHHQPNSLIGTQQQPPLVRITNTTAPTGARCSEWRSALCL